LLVAVLPDSSEKESLFSAQLAHRLLVRLIQKLPTQGEFGVTVYRQSGQREIVCAFGDGSDAALIAKVPTLPSQAARATPSCLMDRQSENLPR
jgi:hypothetical protein